MPDAQSRTALDVTSAGLTDVGKRRSHNEDAILLVPELGLYVVCDGVGGQAKGDVASALAIETMEGFFSEEQEIDESLPIDKALPDGARRLLAAVHEANAQVDAEGGGLPASESMGSTVVAAYAAGGLLHVCHVGDSRCYRYRNGRLEQLTRDHNIRNDALRLNPSLSEERLAKLPTNVVTRALGAEFDVDPDICSCGPVTGDLYLLCSDGLCGFVDEDEIAGALELLADDLEQACAELIALANAAGGKDNISAVLIRVDSVEKTSQVDPRFTLDLPPCEWCGALWASDMTFCSRCGRPPAGAEEEEQEEVEAHCTECGAEVMPDTKFCGNCGKPHGLFEE